MNITLIAAAIGLVVLVVGIFAIVAIKTRIDENPIGDSQQSYPQGAGIGSGIAIGAGLGAALGVALDNMGLGIAIGVAIGAAVGASLVRKNETTRPVSRQEPRLVWGILVVAILLLVGGVILFMLAN